MTRTHRIPDVYAGGRVRASAEIEALAIRWHDEIARVAGGRPLAVSLPRDSDSVALFVAITARPDWFVLLPPDPRIWGSLSLPPDLCVVLPPSLAEVASAVEGIGRAVHVLSSAADVGTVRTKSLDLLSSAGIVLFTSGSTGSPKPVFRPMTSLIPGARVRLDTLGLRPGDGIIAGVTLGHSGGLIRLLSSMLLGGAFALLDPLDHRAALAMLAQPQFALWSATAHFADVLGRCQLTGPAKVPDFCVLSSPVTPAVNERFHRRFGVPLRQNYSSTETAIIAGDYGSAEDVRTGTVGRPLNGVEVRIGERASEPVAPGEVGRIWVRSPWQMAGYGFPPAVERPGDDNGWWPTRDLGALRADGHLALAGRIDDCIRTREGRLVNLAAVASSLHSVEGIDDAVVVPIQGSAGASFGAVLVCDSAASLATIRSRAAAVLPDWAWPRAIVQASALPRLPSGKVDRRSCIRLLEDHAS